MARRRSQDSPELSVPTDDGRSASTRRQTAEAALNHISFTIGRAYYNCLGMLERVHAETGLDKYLQPGMGQILFALFEKDDQAIKELVERVEVSYSTLSGMLWRMKRAGVIDLCRDADDGRSVRVRLTDLGKSLEPRCHLVLQKTHEIMSSDVSEKELRDVQRTLKRMIDAMRNCDKSSPVKLQRGKTKATVARIR